MSELTNEQKEVLLEEGKRQIAEHWPQEPLDPELIPHLQHNNRIGFDMIHHPLVVDVFASPITFGAINRRYHYAKQRLDEALKDRDWGRYVFIHERPYRAEALEHVINNVSVYNSNPVPWKVLGPVLAEVWSDSENIAQNLRFWRRMFRESMGFHWMTEDERIALSKMPDVIELWRGECRDGNVSWSLSEKVAKFFAHRGINKSTGVVSHGYVKREKVFAYLDRRGEEEIIVPNRRNVRALP